MGATSRRPVSASNATAWTCPASSGAAAARMSNALVERAVVRRDGREPLGRCAVSLARAAGRPSRIGGVVRAFRCRGGAEAQKTLK
jgi:hypothetical protein